MKKREFTAIYLKKGKYHLAWIEEVPGVNTQGLTKKEAKENLKEALKLVLDTNRLFARRQAGKSALRETLEVAA